MTTRTLIHRLRGADISIWKDIIKEYCNKRLPTDKEVEIWFSNNIDDNCSASSAIYKYRLWLKDRNNNP